MLLENGRSGVADGTDAIWHSLYLLGRSCEPKNVQQSCAQPGSRPRQNSGTRQPNGDLAWMFYTGDWPDA